MLIFLLVCQIASFFVFSFPLFSHRYRCGVSRSVFNTQVPDCTVKGEKSNTMRFIKAVMIGLASHLDFSVAGNLADTKLAEDDEFWSRMLQVVESMSAPSPCPTFPVDCSVPADCGPPRPLITPSPTPETPAPTTFPRPQCETDDDCAYMDTGEDIKNPGEGIRGVCSDVIEDLGYSVCQGEIVTIDTVFVPYECGDNGTCQPISTTTKVFSESASQVVRNCCVMVCGGRRRYCRYEDCCRRRECPVKCGRPIGGVTSPSRSRD